MTEPPLPKVEAPEPEDAGSKITVGDVLKAVFLPERDSERASLKDSGTMAKAVGAIAASLPVPNSSTPELLLDTPTVLHYPEPIEAVDAGEETRPWLVMSGVLIALGVVILGQLAAIGVSDSLITWVLFVLGGALWSAVLTFQVVLEHKALLLRGPSVSGAGPSGSFQPLNRMDLVLRLTLTGGAIAFAAMTYFLSADNSFRLVGVLTWIASIVCITLALGEYDIFDMLKAFGEDIQSLPSKLMTREALGRSAIVAFILIIGAGFRYYQLNATPAEMTSDHIEKLLDAYRISEFGITSIFFVNNGGREALHFYVVALTANLFGTGWSFLTLKLASTLWAMLLLPVIVLLGRELVDWETGLWTAGLLAVSWWHTVLARLALRISLTPLIFTLVVICLIRGIRTGSRRSWIWAGIWMGIGVYSYQAMRLVPLVAIAACLIAIIAATLRYVRARHNLLLRERATNAAMRQALNLTAAGLIAVVMFVPMLRVWVDFPQQLWNRVINRTTSNEATIQGSAAVVFADNYYDAIRMYNFEGDGAWISAAPDEPTLDIISGALLVLGVSIWLVRIWLRRDAADWFLLVAIILMLLPSALAIAFPAENPSTTRASGTLPLIMVLAAWPLSLIRQYTVRASTPIIYRGATYGLLALLYIGAAGLNFNTFFNTYHEAYVRAAPYPNLLAEAAVQALEEAGSEPDDIDGIWLISYPFWQDHRAFGAELGDITFDRVFVDSTEMITPLVTEPELFEARPLVFVFNQNDQRAEDVLTVVYPEGQLQSVVTEYPGKNFFTYTVP